MSQVWRVPVLDRNKPMLRHEAIYEMREIRYTRECDQVARELEGLIANFCAKRGHNPAYLIIGVSYYEKLTALLNKGQEHLSWPHVFRGIPIIVAEGTLLAVGSPEGEWHDFQAEYGDRNA